MATGSTPSFTGRARGAAAAGGGAGLAAGVDACEAGVAGGGGAAAGAGAILRGYKEQERGRNVETARKTQGNMRWRVAAISKKGFDCAPRIIDDARVGAHVSSRKRSQLSFCFKPHTCDAGTKLQPGVNSAADTFIFGDDGAIKVTSYYLED